MAGKTEIAPLTDAALSELKVLHGAATPGEWGVEQPHGFDCIWTDVVDENGDEIVSAGEILNRIRMLKTTPEQRKAISEKARLAGLAVRRANAAKRKAEEQK